MITYDYCCDKCKITREEIHSIEKDPIIKCECGEVMRRLIGTGAMIEFWDEGRCHYISGTSSKHIDH